MIKFFSVFTVIVFLSSAVRSLAFDTDLNVENYEEIWTYSNQNGFSPVDLNSIQGCSFHQGRDADSKLRVVDNFLSPGLGISIDTPIKQKPTKTSKTLNYISPSSLIRLISKTNNHYSEITLLSETGTDSANAMSGFIETKKLFPLYGHKIIINTFGEDQKTEITLRSFKSELVNCIIGRSLKRFHPFESKGSKKLILIKENNFLLFDSTKAILSPKTESKVKVRVNSNATDVEKDDANLINSGPDIPVIAWTPKQPTVPHQEDINGSPVFNGPSRDVICTMDRSGVDVYSDSKKILKDFSKATNGTTVLVSQDFKPLKINDLNYVKVMFRDNGRIFGWIPEDSYKSRGECNSLNYPEAQYVEVCTAESGFIRTRDKSLGNIVKKVADGTRALVISKKPVKHTILNVEYNFVELLFEGENESLWAPNKFLTSGSCAKRKEELLEEIIKEQEKATKGSYFPLYRHPEGSYIQNSNYTNGRGYKGRRCKNGWARSKNGSKYCPKSRRRNHAATDLLTRKSKGSSYKGEMYRSIGSGIVLREADSFYQNTYEVIVLDDKTGQIYRYGEVYPQYHDPEDGNAKNDIIIKAGNKWRANQRVGYIKAVSRRSTPMLHFELYSAGAKDITLKNPNGIDKQSSLRGPWGPFYRHKNLVDPTDFIRSLEKTTPGLLPNRHGVTW